MPTEPRLFYDSANGDRWHLARDPEAGRVVVRHTPNAASGGRRSTIGIGAFLARNQEGNPSAEQQALLALIATLLDDQPPAAEPIPSVIIGTFD